MHKLLLICSTILFSFQILDNLEIRQIIDFDVVQKDGKDYIKIKNIRVHLKLAKFSVQFKSKTGNQAVNDTVNKVINENWRDIFPELKPDLEKNIADVVKSIISPLFSEIPYQDFYLQ